MQRQPPPRRCWLPLNGHCWSRATRKQGFLTFEFEHPPRRRNVPRNAGRPTATPSRRPFPRVRRTSWRRHHNSRPNTRRPRQPGMRQGLISVYH
ncbi:hypothetical protein BCV69DRAFT_214347 [Microstroma glucosiphilum]|uniref:Uncharacterized protein n=1 Tax=Pseudomicrostroma glucosiphilum TaxID=1684307 RepID=A0A316U3V9_9BASI|nr:hypothetical protein BCV69DRAFT_214347 [Pseudomicrostroma glucosiphilum]PWN19969.1 hypothetical protein BCV69DRAFT_214347 [Pseudomicrostroma glucosiphilum]